MENEPAPASNGHSLTFCLFFSFSFRRFCCMQDGRYCGQTEKKPSKKWRRIRSRSTRKKKMLFYCFHSVHVVRVTASAHRLVSHRNIRYTMKAQKKIKITLKQNVSSFNRRLLIEAPIPFPDSNEYCCTKKINWKHIQVCLFQWTSHGVTWQIKLR